MYPDDHLILEDGIWRLWNLSLDEPYFEMPDWKGGWSPAKDQPSCDTPNGPAVTAAGDPQRTATAPDDSSARRWSQNSDPMCRLPSSASCRSISAVAPASPGNGRRSCRCGGATRIPVSGRPPELFLPDCVPCGYSPNMSMVKHGYLLPTTDPVKSED